ncbi:glycosyltransferase [Pontibacter vulgaris]|uniref:glycosyltransferase n=1 Tax=Pontibacter vulgaris TaxID=2905679 RepID=UPI001FA80158|nr:glycosyltransferase [Pontibacter vulgaris]
MAKQNILLITVRADHGGGPRHVDLLINNITSNYRIFVACPADKPYFEEWKGNNVVEDIFLLPHRKFKSKYLIKLANYIAANNITIVHSHGKGAGVYARLLKLFNANLKVIHTFHGVHTMNYGSAARKVYHVYERIANKLTDKFINVSYGERDICLANKYLTLDKQVTIYNGVPDLAALDIEDDPSHKQKFRVVTLSRFDIQKNMHLAFEIAKLLQSNSGIEFLWVGDGEDKEALEREAEKEGINNIIFTGFSKEPEVYLKSAHLYLSTSRWEGLPLALIEAASLSIPIVATDVTGNNEVVQNGVNGYLYEPNSPAAAAKRILDLSLDKGTYKSLAINSRTIYENYFTVDKMVASTEQVYNG